MKEIAAMIRIIQELRKNGNMKKTEAKPLSFKILLNELIHRKGF